MRTNLYLCAKPGEANHLALRYLFVNAKYNDELASIAYSLIQTITGFDPFQKRLKITHIWPTPLQSVGLNVEIHYGDDLYLLSFFFFEYDNKEPIVDEMLSSTVSIRGMYGSKGCFLIHYRPEDSSLISFREYGKMPTGVIQFVHIDSTTIFNAIGKMSCADPYIAEYLQYISIINDWKTTEEWDRVWLTSPVGLENYVDNYLRYLFQRKYEWQDIPLRFVRSDWKTCRIQIAIDTNFKDYDSNENNIQSWFVIEFLMEFPRPVMSISLKGDCFCLDDPDLLVKEEIDSKAFDRMRKLIDQEGSLFISEDKTTINDSIIGTYREGGVMLNSEHGWSVLFPEIIFNLTDNIISLTH